MFTRAIRLPVMSCSIILGLAGCSAISTGSQPLAIDLAPIRCPAIQAEDVAALKADVIAPKAPVSKADTAKWIDALYSDRDRKKRAGWRLVMALKACRGGKA